MKWWLISVLTLSFFGCGSLKVRDVNSAEVKTVRRVAVASFSFLQPQAATVLGTGAQDMTAHESDEVTGCWKDIASTLSSNMRWSVLPFDEMRENPAYKTIYDGKMKGWQTNKVPHQGKLYLVPGVMDAQSIRRMKPAERDQLMSALKVDALMEAQVNVSFHVPGMAVMGLGSRHPQAVINFWMYKRGVEAPVWFDGRVVGEASAKSVGATGFFDETEVTRLGRLSARGAFEKLGLKTQ